MGYKKANDMIFWSYFTTTNFAANTNYYIGSVPSQSAKLAATLVNVYAPYDGTIEYAELKLNGSATTAEDWTWNLYDGAADYPVGTVGDTNNLKRFVNDNLNLTIAKNTPLCWHCLTPNPWVTPSTGVTGVACFVLRH